MTSSPCQAEPSGGFGVNQIDLTRGREGAGKISGRCAKQLRKTVQIGNGGIEVAAERQLRPALQFLRPKQLAVYRQFVLTLPHVKLIDLEATIVISGAEHYHIGPPRAPGEVGRFHPDRGGCIEKFAGVAAKSKLRGADRTGNRLQKTDRARDLGERDFGRRARQIDGKFVPARPWKLARKVPP